MKIEVQQERNIEIYFFYKYWIGNVWNVKNLENNRIKENFVV